MKNQIVVNGVTYYAQLPESNMENPAQEKFDWLKSIIVQELHAAQALYDNCKQEGLAFNSIEAEGYLRCAKRLHNDLMDIETNYET